MELKTYQKRVLDDLSSYISYYNLSQNASKSFKEYWRSKGVETGSSNFSNYVDKINGVPNVTLKVPTGGGKTFIGCAAIETILNYKLSNSPVNAVVWLVPSDSILNQTIKALENANHPYRQYLDRAFNHRVNVYSKEDALNAINFNISTVKENLSIFVFSYSSFKNTKDGRKSRKENTAYVDFKQAFKDYGFAIGGQTEEFSLLQTINYFNPLVIIDESHNAGSSLSIEMIKDFNPSIIVDLTATPRDDSNIISYVDAKALKKAEMIKLPLLVYNRYDKEEVLATAIDLQHKLEIVAKNNYDKTGRYIRPIVLFQAQEKGEGNMTYSEIKTNLLDRNIPENQIKIKTAEVDEISSLDLMSDKCEVRYIITVNALKEGWDCPFAYILASIANRSSKIDVEQVIGRVLRLPYTKLNPEAPVLNSSYVITSSKDFYGTAASISNGLRKSGYSDDDYRIVSSKEVEQDIDSSTKSLDLNGLFSNDVPTYNGFSKNDENTSSNERNSNDFAINPANLSEFTDEDISNMNENYTQHGNNADDIISTAMEQTKAFEEQIRQIPDDAIPEDVRKLMKPSKLKPGFAELARKIEIPQFFKMNSLISIFDGSDKFLYKDMLLDKYSLNSASLPKNLTEINNNVFAFDIDENGQSSELSRQTVDLQSSSWSKFLEMYDDTKKMLYVVQTIAAYLSKKFNVVPDKDILDYLNRLFKNFTIDELDYVINNMTTVSDSIRRHIAADMEKYRIEKFNEMIDRNQIQLKPSFKFLPEINAINTSNKISKSLYEAEPMINGDEEKAISNIASLDNVVFWHHIRQKENGEFYINGYINHYPDFVIYTKKGNIILVEFKGEDRKNEDSQIKVKLGRKWNDLAGNNYRYFMVFLEDAFKEEGAYNLSSAISIIKNL